MPSHIYALFENARRYERKQTLEKHRQEIGELCATMGRVAADNPHAWFRRQRSPEEFCTVSPRNRMVAFPYTKLMCSMIFVDQSSAVRVSICSVAMKRLGVSKEQLFPGLDVVETYTIRLLQLQALGYNWFTY